MDRDMSSIFPAFVELHTRKYTKSQTHSTVFIYIYTSVSLHVRTCSNHSVVARAQASHLQALLALLSLGLAARAPGPCMALRKHGMQLRRLLLLCKTKCVVHVHPWLA